MARRKREIPAPPAILRVGPDKPHRIERGVVVQLREGRNGDLTDRKAIVMGNTPASDYTRAYGREVFVCEMNYGGDVKRDTMVAKDALKSGRKSDAVKIISEATTIHETNVTMLKPVGRVKKIPWICSSAMKIEKGKL